MLKFWNWIRTEKKVVKPLPSKLGLNASFYIPSRDEIGPMMVSDYTERQLQEMYPPLKDAYEQYQILLKMYDGKHQSLFRKARDL